MPHRDDRSSRHGPLTSYGFRNAKDREPVKRRNDAAQARAVARLVVRYMPNLPYVADQLTHAAETRL